MNPDERDEEREGPDFDGTSRRLERPKSSGERKKIAEGEEKSRQRLLEATAVGRRLRGRSRTEGEALATKHNDYKRRQKLLEQGLANLRRNREKLRETSKIL